MTLQFAVLGSGSRGNAALVCQEGGTGVLIDIGLGPRALEQRLASVQSDWSRISAVLLTHTHGDHVESATLQSMVRRGVMLYCHETHRNVLELDQGFQDLDKLGLVRHFDGQPFLAPAGSGSSRFLSFTTVRPSASGSSRSPGGGRGRSGSAIWPTAEAGRKAWRTAWPMSTSWASNSITMWPCRKPPAGPRL